MEELVPFAQLILALLGVGGLTKIVTAYLEGRSRERPLTEKKAAEAEAVTMAQDTGLLAEWERYAGELTEQNRNLWEQNKALWVQNQELADQNALLRSAASDAATQRALSFSYINELRSHINRQLPPPPPQWPDELMH